MVQILVQSHSTVGYDTFKIGVFENSSYSMHYSSKNSVVKFSRARDIHSIINYKGIHLLQIFFNVFFITQKLLRPSSAIFEISIFFHFKNRIALFQFQTFEPINF